MAMTSNNKVTRTWAASLAIVLAILVTAAGSVQAQDALATLKGTVVAGNSGGQSGVTITLQGPGGAWRTVVSDRGGLWSAADLKPGMWTVRAVLSGFEAVQATVVDLPAGEVREVELRLEHATFFGAITVTAKTPEAGAPVDDEDLAARCLGSSDSARLLEGSPGLSFYSGGGVSSLPVINGLADDRVRILVNGVAITSSCPNHMNPALSYVDPTAVARVSVMAGITPVSLGGDSIGGTIVVRSAEPQFAAEGEGLRSGGSVSAYYRSNGEAPGGSVRVGVASERFSLVYSGARAESGNYEEGGGGIVRSGEFKAENSLLTLATRFGRSLVSLEASWQEIPYQGFANQYMDMTGNRSFSLNARFQQELTWGRLEVRAYRQRVQHEMNMLEDKRELGLLTFGMPYEMPMNTEGVDTGYALQGDIQVSTRSLLRVGHEAHRYTLDDWWPALPGSMMMGPDTFWNIRDGKRERLAAFGEMETRWSSAWSSQLGVRVERVTMDTGPVQGYFGGTGMGMGMDTGMGMDMSGGAIYQDDADAFNARDRQRTDHNVDVTAVARYEPGPNTTWEVGVARKVRSPSLYERYVWSNEAGMAGSMNSKFGDLNAYVGNLDLEPEVAFAFRTSVDWHDGGRREWQLRIAPFYTRVFDAIDVEPVEVTTTPPPPGRVALRFVNQDARLYGVDLSFKRRLGRAAGDWSGRGVLSYVRGENLDGDHDLYNVMPLNARLALDHSLGDWSSSLEVQLVDAKDKVDSVRQELATPGYSLVNLRTRYRWGSFQIDAGIDNLLDRRYELPLGGLDFYRYNYLSPATGGELAGVRGPGRSANLGVTFSF